MTLSYNSAKNLLCCSLTALSFVSVASAANIELSKFIEVGASTTDNLTLANTDKESDQVINVTPSVELKYSGNRFGLVAIGELDYRRFSNSEDYIFDPSLFTRLRGTLIDNFMFLDSSLAITKSAADNSFTRPTDDGETSATSNTTLSIEKGFGQFADLYAGYNFSTLAERAGDDFGSSEHSVNFSLERDPKYNGFLWGVGGFYSRDESQINEFEDRYVYGKLGVALNETLLAVGTYGVENRRLISNTEGEIPIATEFEDTPLWRIDFNWTPNDLTKLTLGYEDRFFGSGPTMRLQRRVRNSSISASYTRDISRQVASLDGVSTLAGNPDTSITNTDSVTVNNTNNLAPLDEPFVDTRFQLGYKLTGRQSDLIADIVYSDQESLSGDETINSLLGRLAFDRRLSEFMSIRLQYDYQKSEASDRTNFNYDENRFAIKFTYSFDGNRRSNDNEFDDLE